MKRLLSKSLYSFNYKFKFNFLLWEGFNTIAEK